MGRHTAPLTRQHLVQRYATIRHLSRARAAVVCAQWGHEELRQIVEAAEAAKLDAAVMPGRRMSFARSLPTTSVQGQTR